MSITDELREYVWQHATNNDELRAIADRIDAEHQKALDEQFKALTVDMQPMTEENMAADGWVRLPKDADGVPWHIGDRTESGQTVEAMSLNGKGWCFVGTVNEIDPAIHRHYHAPAVDDVLYESLKHFGAVEERTPEVEEWLHEQAKRLTLAGDAE